MDWYFYIACINTTGLLVLDVAEERQKRGRPLVLRAKNENITQLWKWGPDATITNKQDNLALDVRKSFRKAGRIAIADSKKENVNQGWHLVDHQIISNRLNLALAFTESNAGTSVALQVIEKTNEQSQKWMLVPENAWEEFHSAHRDDKPLEQTCFYHVAAEYIHAILGCTLDDYEAKVEQCASLIKTCADKLDPVTTGTEITKTIGGATAVLGGTAILVGIGLAPFSLGTSLVFTVGGAMASVAGGTTSLFANIINQVWEKKKREEMRLAITPAITATFNFQAFFKSYNDSLERAISLVKTPRGRQLAVKMIDDYKNIVSTAYTSVAISKTTFKCVGHVKNFTAIQRYTRSINGLNRLTRIAADNNGSLVAKGISGSVAVVGLAFGIWDVWSGAKQIRKKVRFQQNLGRPLKVSKTTKKNF